MKQTWLYLGAFLALFVLFQQRASAQDLSACGSIYVEAEASCVLEPPSAECRTRCTPVSVSAVCAAELYADCAGQCRADVEASCSVSECSAQCTLDCEVDPGRFDCQAACAADCGATCVARCDAEPDMASCMASCEGSCSAGCEASCDIELPNADCQEWCDASCDASCDAQANLDCQIDCQADGFAACEVDVQGGCETACRADEGALFCEGDYVDSFDVDECAAALEALLDVRVESSGRCVGDTCRGTIRASAGCNVAPPAADGRGRWATVALVPFALGLLGRRRRRQRLTVHRNSGGH